MPTFSTPTPIDLAIRLSVGEITVVASDRSDTVVTVSPTNADKPTDRRGAEETKVDFDGQRLTVKGPKPRFSIIGPSESIDVRIELPAGSRLTAETYGLVRSTGQLGATRIKSSAVDLDATGDLWIRALHGSVVVGTVDGTAEITADHGQIRVGSVASDAILKASHGSVTVGEAGSDVEAKLSYGDFEIGKATASVAAKTAYGTIQLDEVSSGSIQVESGYGQITIGIRSGVPTWLDLSSREGRVRNQLDGERNPEGSGQSESAGQSVAVRARTQFGDITIQNA